MMNIGLGVGFVPGMFYDRFGPTLTSGAGLIVSVPAYLLIWSSVKYTSFYSKRAWLMSIYFLLAGKYIVQAIKFGNNKISGRFIGFSINRRNNPFFIQDGILFYKFKGINALFNYLGQLYSLVPI